MPKIKVILAIETSCDETSIALVEASGTLRQAQGKTLRFKVLKNIVSSQIPIHRPFGGVVPNLAKREHIKNLPIILKRILRGPTSQIEIIAVTVGPGLEPALWTGINFAEELSKKLKIPLIGVNHMEGHLYSCFLPKTTGISNSKFLISKKNKIKTLSPKPSTLYPKIQFPAIALIVSGGHTILLKMSGINKWEKLGETLDDAAGEAFDKVAKMLKLPYPGGPEIQKTSERGNPNAIKFPRPMLSPRPGRQKNYDFSFSGLKTSVLYYLRDNPKTKKADVAASFQQAVIDVLVKKTMRAVKEFKVKTVFLCGGVAANKLLRESLKVESEKSKVKFIVPDSEYNTDNAVMVAAAAYINLLSKKKKLPMEADGNLSI